MSAMASQITSLAIVYSTVYSDTHQRKHQSSASLGFVQGIHRWPVNSPQKWPVTRNVFPFDYVIMVCGWSGCPNVWLCWVTWWRHQMWTFSALLAIRAGDSSVTGEVPAQRPVTQSFDVFVDLRLNTRLRKQSWGWRFETLSHQLWRHCNDLLGRLLWIVIVSLAVSDFNYFFAWSGTILKMADEIYHDL